VVKRLTVTLPGFSVTTWPVMAPLSGSTACAGVAARVAARVSAVAEASMKILRAGLFIVPRSGGGCGAAVGFWLMLRVDRKRGRRRRSKSLRSERSPPLCWRPYRRNST
jgi:hypothetical protein